MKRFSAVATFALLLLAVPAFGADRVIPNGTDLWLTPGDGTTFADFSKQPIPAGFFCHRSEQFTGRIVLKGMPIATDRPADLRSTDTIIQRLDNATFNKRGVATTRIQMRAMQFEALAPLKTACGDFKLYVELDGEQPITTMRVIRDNAKGGRFYAPIHVNIKLVFKPVGFETTEVFEVRKALRFPPADIAFWSYMPRNAGVQGFVKVDTDSDGTPDTFLPGTSNFSAGRPSPLQKIAAPSSTTNCHTEDEGQHCPGGMIYY